MSHFSSQISFLLGRGALFLPLHTTRGTPRRTHTPPHPSHAAHLARHRTPTKFGMEVDDAPHEEARTPPRARPRSTVVPHSRPFVGFHPSLGPPRLGGAEATTPRVPRAWPHGGRRRPRRGSGANPPLPVALEDPNHGTAVHQGCSARFHSFSSRPAGLLLCRALRRPRCHARGPV